MGISTNPKVFVNRQLGMICGGEEEGSEKKE